MLRVECPDQGHADKCTLLAASFGKQGLLERKLLFLRVQATIKLVVLGQDSISLGVQNDQSFD
jgi:hypothetical protein